MKPKDYVVLMIIVVISMAFVPVEPCIACWVHIYSEKSDGSDNDSYTAPDYTYGWEYEVLDWGTSADSGGVSTYAYSYAMCWVCVTAIEGQSKSRDPSAGCGTDAKSYYYENNPQNPDPLNISWSIEVRDGLASCYGLVDDHALVAGSTHASSSASAGADADDEYACSVASGYATTRREDGSAYIYVGGHAEEDYGYVNVGPGWYGAGIEFSCEIDDSYTAYGLTQFTADVGTSSNTNCYGSATASEGVTMAAPGSEATCTGDASVSVSW